MTRNTLFCCLLLWAASVSPLPAQQNSYQSDFRQIRALLEARHPGLTPRPLPIPFFHHFQAAADSVEALLAHTTTNDAFYLTVMPFINRLGDGHAWLSQSMRQGRYLPIQLRFFDDDAVIIAVGDSALTSLRHARVLAIGGRPVKEVEAAVNAMQGRDWHNPDQGRKHRFGNGFWMSSELMLRQLGLCRGDSVSLRLARDGREFESALAFLGPEQLPMANPFSRNAFTAVKDQHRFHYHETSRSLYFQFGCALPPLEAAFVDSMMAAAVDQQAQWLVLDLRCMSGGDAQPLVDLFRYTIADTTDGRLYRVWQRDGAENRCLFDGHYALLPVPSARRFEGRVVIFTSRTTFSAGTFPVVFAMDNGLATVMGSPCGNNSLRYGQSEKVRLVHSGLTFSFSTRIWERMTGRQSRLMPDIVVAECLEDFIAGRDAVWDRFLQLTQTR